MYFIIPPVICFIICEQLNLRYWIQFSPNALIFQTVLFHLCIISFFQIHCCSFKSRKKIPRVYLKCFDGISTKQESNTCENLKAKNVTAKNCTFCTKQPWKNLKPTPVPFKIQLCALLLRLRFNNTANTYIKKGITVEFRHMEKLYTADGT